MRQFFDQTRHIENLILIKDTSRMQGLSQCVRSFFPRRLRKMSTFRPIKSSQETMNGAKFHYYSWKGSIRFSVLASLSMLEGSQSEQESCFASHLPVSKFQSVTLFQNSWIKILPHLAFSSATRPVDGSRSLRKSSLSLQGLIKA